MASQDVECCAGDEVVGWVEVDAVGSYSGVCDCAI